MFWFRQLCVFTWLCGCNQMMLQKKPLTPYLVITDLYMCTLCMCEREWGLKISTLCTTVVMLKTLNEPFNTWQQLVSLQWNLDIFLLFVYVTITMYCSFGNRTLHYIFFFAILGQMDELRVDWEIWGFEPTGSNPSRVKWMSYACHFIARPTTLLR